MIESIAFGPAIGKDTIFSSKEALIAARPRRQPDRNLTELVVWRDPEDQIRRWSL
jgi:hypothetical protein